MAIYEQPVIKHGVPTRWGWVVLYPEGLTMPKDNWVDIGYGTLIQAKCGVWIGGGVQIGAGVRIYSESTIDDEQEEVVIKRGACIGANSVIMPGAKIGEFVKIGALTFVPRGEYPEGTWVGQPARRVK